jgi:hypothetical protein
MSYLYGKYEVNFSSYWKVFLEIFFISSISSERKWAGDKNDYAGHFSYLTETIWVLVV